MIALGSLFLQDLNLHNAFSRSVIYRVGGLLYEPKNNSLAVALQSLWTTI